VTSSTPSTCDFVGCDEAESGRYLHLRQDQAVDFPVCAAHFARIERGERPVLVVERVDLPDRDGRPALFLDN
jgi:hypothetical protein